MVKHVPVQKNWTDEVLFTTLGSLYYEGSSWFHRYISFKAVTKIRHVKVRFFVKRLSSIFIFLLTVG
jgi:hypothetical protein